MCKINVPPILPYPYRYKNQAEIHTDTDTAQTLILIPIPIPDISPDTWNMFEPSKMLISRENATN